MSQDSGVGPPKRVLIVDDEDEVSRFMEEVLALDGWRVDRASSAGEAMKYFAKNAYDLITLDCVMPEMDGRGFHKILSQAFGHGYRTSENLPQRLPPILIVTAWFDEAGMQQLLYAEQVFGVLRKPVSCQQLKEKALEAWQWGQGGEGH